MGISEWVGFRDVGRCNLDAALQSDINLHVFFYGVRRGDVRMVVGGARCEEMAKRYELRSS